MHWCQKAEREEAVMAKKITKKAEDVHKIYVECKKVFEPSTDLFDEIEKIEDDEEKEFYLALCDFFLQQAQKETIAEEVY